MKPHHPAYRSPHEQMTALDLSEAPYWVEATDNLGIVTTLDVIAHSENWLLVRQVGGGEVRWLNLSHVPSLAVVEGDR